MILLFNPKPLTILKSKVYNAFIFGLLILLGVSCQSPEKTGLILFVTPEYQSGPDFQENYIRLQLEFLSNIDTSLTIDFTAFSWKRMGLNPDPKPDSIFDNCKNSMDCIQRLITNDEVIVENREGNLRLMSDFEAFPNSNRGFPTYTSAITEPKLLSLKADSSYFQSVLISEFDVLIEGSSKNTYRLHYLSSKNSSNPGLRITSNWFSIEGSGPD